MEAAQKISKEGQVSSRFRNAINFYQKVLSRKARFHGGSRRPSRRVVPKEFLVYLIQFIEISATI